MFNDRSWNEQLSNFRRFVFRPLAAIVVTASAASGSAQVDPWCTTGANVLYPSLADGASDCAANSSVEFVSGSPGYYQWTTTPSTAFDSACWWELISDFNQSGSHHMEIALWAQDHEHANIPSGYPLGVHLASTPPVGDFLPPSPNLYNDSVALLPPGSGNEQTWWDDLGRPTIDQKIDLVTGLPLVSSQDLELPFGGEFFTNGERNICKSS